MTTRLVEQHAPATRADHNGNRARRSRAGGKLGDGSLGGASSHLLDIRLIEQLEADGATGRLAPGLQTGVAARDTRHREKGADLVVLGEHTIGVGDQDAATGVAVAGRHLRDRAALGPSGLVGEGEQADLGRFSDVLGRDSNRGRTFDIDRRDGDDLRPTPATASRGGSSLGGGRQPRLGEVGGVSETRGVADDNPDAGASITPTG